MQAVWAQMAAADAVAGLPAIPSPKQPPVSQQQQLGGDAPSSSERVAQEGFGET